jgi:hypothetical protein
MQSFIVNSHITHYDEGSAESLEPSAKRCKCNIVTSSLIFPLVAVRTIQPPHKCGDVQQ